MAGRTPGQQHGSSPSESDTVSQALGYMLVALIAVLALVTALH